ncbi:unnamed protein product [Gulo gulo]|jgi:hypothetical protein
MTSG